MRGRAAGATARHNFPLPFRQVFRRKSDTVPFVSATQSALVRTRTTVPDLSGFSNFPARKAGSRRVWKIRWKERFPELGREGRCIPRRRGRIRSDRFQEATNSIREENEELPLHVHACCRQTASRGEARSMESGIIADVDRLKESRRGDPLPYLCNERSLCVSCLRPRPEHTERERDPLSTVFLPPHSSSAGVPRPLRATPRRRDAPLTGVPENPLGLIGSTPLVTPFLLRTHF